MRRPDQWFPLTRAQWHVWTASRRCPGAYVLTEYIDVRGAFDARVFEQALRATVAAVDELRLRVRDGVDGPQQVVTADHDWRLPQIDLSAEPDPAAAAEAWMRADRARGVRPESEPPFRYALIRVGPDRHFWYVLYHHVAVDGQGGALIRARVAATYTRLARGLALDDTPTLSLAEAVSLDEEYRASAQYERDRAFWREQLRDLPEPATLSGLPPAAPAEIAVGAGGAADPELGARLDAGAASLRISVPQLLALAAGIYVHRATGAAEVVLGVPVSGRTKTTRNSVVTASNVLPIRLAFAAGSRVSEVAAQMARTVRLALRHQRYRSEDLRAEAGARAAVTPYGPAVNVFPFTVDASFDGTEGLNCNRSNGPVTDVMFAVFPTGASGVGVIAYGHPDRYTEADLERHRHRYLRVLDAIVAAPGQRLHEVRFVASDERSWLLAPPAVSAEPPPGSIVERFEAQAARTPDRVALTNDGESLTYREVSERANRLARLLVSRGAGPETRVAIALDRSLDLIVTIVAVLKTGAAYLPIDPDDPQSRVSAVIADANPVCVVTAGAVMPATAAAVVAIDDERTMAALREMPCGNLAADERLGDLGPGHPAYVIYTSGSTGAPKGVVVSHANVTRLFDTTAPAFGFDETGVWTLFHSCAFDFSVWELWGALFHGGRLVIVPKSTARQPADFLALLVRERVTVLSQTPSAFYALIEAERGLPAPASLALRHVVFGGEALDLGRLAGWSARHATGPVLVNMYGITETTVHVTQLAIAPDDIHGQRGSLIGTALPDLALYVLDSALEPAPIGQTGEIYVAGAGLARGYLGRPGLTAARFVADPHSRVPGARMYRSGDLARRLEDGSLQYLGRADQQVKVRGFRIELGEIESTLLSHAGITAVAVVPIERGAATQLAAYVVGDADPSGLREWLRERLPEHMVPAFVMAVPALPLTRNGKLDRRALPQPLGTGREGRAPATPTEIALAPIWSEVLGAPVGDIDEGFFESGGDSLGAARLHQRLVAAFGPVLTLAELLAASTIARTAARIDGGQPAHASSGLASTDEHEHALSFAQERLWFVQQLRPGSAAYNIPFVLRLDGPLDAGRLARCVTAVVAHHAPLRSRFVDRAGQPLVVVDAPGPVAVPLVDLSAIPAPEREAALATRIRAEGLRPFAIDREHSFRALLLRDDTTRHLLVMTFHHLVCDGRSLDVFLEDLAAAYAADESGAVLPPLSCRFADVVAAERRAPMSDATGYWKRQLAGAPATLGLTTDRARPDVPSFAGDVRRFTIDAPLAAALRQLARRTDSSLFMTLLSGFALLLRKMTGERDLVIGTAIDVRDHDGRDADRLVGLFVNLLALRCRVDDQQSLAGLVAEVRQVCLDAYAHKRLPFEQVVDALALERRLDRPPLVQVIFSLQPSPATKTAGAIAMTAEPLQTATARFDLETYVVDHGDTLEVSLAYATDLFADPTIDALGEAYLALLSAIAAADAAPVGRLSALDVNARRAALEHAAGAIDTAADECLHALVEAQVDRTPDAIAVVSEEITLSYRELDACANALAVTLRALGGGPDRPVAICMERSAEMIVALLGVLKAGGAFIPLDPAYPSQRVAAIATDCRPVAIISDRASQDRMAATVACPVIGVDLSAREGTRPVVPVSAGNLAYVIYTSGSTGTPKGVGVPHRGIANQVEWMRHSHPLAPGDTIVQKTPLTFDVAMWEIFSPLAGGARLFVARPGGHGDPGYLREVIRKHAVTDIHFVPSMLQAYLDDGDGRELPRVRRLFASGEALPAALAARALARFAGECHNFYGPTEASVHASAWRVTAGDAAVAIGYPVRNTQLYVLDDQLEPAPIGASGELFIGGTGVARGYWGRAALTAERFVADPFSRAPGARLYRTGDRVRRRADGAIEYLGRLDRQVKLRGFRIELGEVEAAVAADPRVAQAVVTVRELAGEAQLVAYVRLHGRAGDEATIGVELKRRLVDSLPAYMVPAAFVTVAAFPTTANGKLDLRALPAPAAATPNAVERRPVTSTEQALAEVWRQFLPGEVDAATGFFDAGGTSLLAIRVCHAINDRFGTAMSVLDFFSHPTISAQARFIGASGPEGVLPRAGAVAGGGREGASRLSGAPVPIAVIGLQVRVPGARSVEEFWRNLCEGVESITFFSDDELAAAGVSPERLGDPRYVKARGLVDGVDRFDAAFFGVTPRDAALTDPQQRLMLQAAWELLERAGYETSSPAGTVGVFTGASLSTYLLRNLSGHPNISLDEDGLQLAIGNGPDHIPAQVSYRLNLTGPSVHVGTACSSSLTAVALACQSLRRGDCDMAIAGGVSVTVPVASGYLYHDGGTVSPDGHCRAFDARAQGAVPGSGLGLVLLKRLDQAVADGDHIHAVIRGVGMNNEGGGRVGYTAPGVAGQAAAIVSALDDAQVDPATIGYVEAHGTGTPIGDPIEVEALTKAYRSFTDRVGYCAIGSVKTNVGHLDAAAGVVSLIKAVLAVERGEIPPSLHFTEANPRIALANSPVFVNGERRGWPVPSGPRRAGVTSLGLTGTNVHVVLEEAPGRDQPRDARPRPQVLCLSAKTEAALASAADRLAAHLEAHESTPLADVAYTLQVGRRAFPHKQVVIGDSVSSAIAELRGGTARRHGVAETGSRSAAFLFSGLGSQYAGMGHDLYLSEPVFRDAMQQCAQALRPWLGVDLLTMLYPSGLEAKGTTRGRQANPFARLRPRQAAPEAGPLHETRFAHPAIFAFEYSLATLLRAWGVTPLAMIGHSIGEYAAACMAGVMTLAEAAKLVAGRAELLQRQPAGAVVAVPLSAAEIEAKLHDELFLSAANAPAMSLVGGTLAAVERLEQQLRDEGIATRRLVAGQAFHTPLLAPMRAEFLRLFDGIALRAPATPYISTATGGWVTAAMATDPEYWFAHTSGTVRFADAVTTLARDCPGAPMVEIGAGRELVNFARMQLRSLGADVPVVVPVTGQEDDAEADGVWLADAIGRLWLAGVAIDWRRLHGDAGRRRLALPTYAFDERRYWIDPASTPVLAAAQAAAVEPARLQVPQWRNSPLGTAPAPPQRVLLFMDATGLAVAMAAALRTAGHDVTCVRCGDSFTAHADGEFAIVPHDRDHQRRLFETLRQSNRLPGVVVHAGSVGAATDHATSRQLFLGLLYAVQAFHDADAAASARFHVIADGLFDVSGSEPIAPGRSLVLGVTRVVSHEYERLDARAISIEANVQGPALGALAATLAREVTSAATDQSVAYRGRTRSVLAFAPVVAGTESSTLKSQGVYVIVGGLGGVGFEMATHLARTCEARLVLVGRNATQDAGPVERLRHLGAEVLVVAGDVTSRDDMAAVRRLALERFGAVHGVIHAATPLGGGGLQLAGDQRLDEEMAAKVIGAGVLADTFAGAELDFLLLCSSVTAISGGAGAVAYCAANAFLDAFAHARGRDRVVVAVNWDRWDGIGIAVAGEKAFTAITGRKPLPGLSVDEALRAFEQALAIGTPQVVVAKTSLDAHAALAEVTRAGRAPVEPVALPAGTPVELRIAAIWESLFGIGDIGVDDDFFALGGTSLLATQAASRVARDTGAPVTLRMLFDHPTIRGLSAAVSALDAANDPPPAAMVAAHDPHPPLSFTQTRLWFMEQLSPGQAQYNVPIALRLEGPLDVDALAGALAAIVHRHDTLRSRIVTVEGTPRLTVLSEQGIDVEVVEAASLEAAQALAQEFSTRGFDIASDPPIRASVFRVSPTDHLLAVTMHHIVSDGWSVGVLMRELQALYPASRTEPSPLAPLTVQYGDFAAWQREQLAGPALDRQRRFWRQALADAPPLLALPTDRPRPSAPTFRGGIRSCVWPRTTVDRLAAVSRDHGVTPFMTLLAAFASLLGRYTGQDDVLIGSPVANRSLKELEPLIGAFVNTVVFRTDLAGNPTFTDLLQRTRRVCLDAFAHQDLPFEKLVDEINPERHTDRHPIVQVVLAMQDRAFFDVALPGLAVTPIELAPGAARLDLEVHLAERADGMQVTFGYAADLFDAATIDRMMRQLTLLVEAAVDAPGERAAALRMATREEEQRMLAALDRGACEAVPWLSAHALMEQAAHRDPDAIAIVEITNAVDAVDAILAGDPDAAQLAAGRTLRFKQSPFTFTYGAEAASALRVVDPAGADEMRVVRAHGGAYAGLNPAAAALLRHFDGREPLSRWFDAVRAGGRRLLLLDLRIDRDRGQILTTPHEVPPGASFAAFARFACTAYRLGLLDAAGVADETSSAVAVQVDWNPPALPTYEVVPEPAFTGQEPPRNGATMQPVLLVGETAGTGSIGLVYLASYLRRHGVEAVCQLTDFHADADAMRANVRELIDRVKPRVLGVSLKWFPHIARALEICRTAKTYDPTIHTVLGGDTASYFRDELLAERWVDSVISGDGEEPLLQLVTGQAEVANYHGPAGAGLQTMVQGATTYVQDKTTSAESYLTDLGELFVDRADPFLTSSFFMSAGKGCSANCFYCAGARENQRRVFNRPKAFMRTPDGIRNDLLRTRPYASTYLFDFDLPGIDFIEPYRAIWDAVDLSAHFAEFYFWKLPPPAFIDLVARTFRYVHLNIDLPSLSERHRLFLMKQMPRMGVKPQPTDAELLAFFTACGQHANVHTGINLINGLPHLTEEDMAASTRMLSRIMGQFPSFQSVSWGRLHAQPGAPMTVNPAGMGMKPAARTYEDYLGWSRRNMEESSYPDVATLHYPLIYFEDDSLNTQVSAHYADITTRMDRFRETRERARLGRREITYRQLDARATALAAELRARGVAGETRLGVCAERSVEWVVAMLAVLKAGAVYVPIDPGYPSTRVAAMLADAGITLVLTTTAERPAALPADGPAVLEVPRCDAAEPGETGHEPATPDQLAYVIYTSGSTGAPKGVQVSHRGVANLARSQSQAFAVERDSRVLQFASPGFDASISEVFMALANGAALCFAARDVSGPGRELAAMLQELQVTHITLPPSILALLPHDALPALKTVIVAGEAAVPGVIDYWAASRRVVNGYGPTETTVCATMGDCTGVAGTTPSIGVPMNGVRVRILDRFLVPAPVGVPGELCVGGPALARGYSNSPAATAERFVADPWLPGARLYRTGDLARLRDDGTIEFLGRIDEQLKINGVRIEPGDIEAALLAHPRVSSACVLAKDNSQGISVLAAYVAVDDARDPAALETEIRGFIAGRLPQHLLPGRVIVCERLPLTPSGKVDRRALPTPDAVSARSARTAPRTPEEATLAEVWRAVLGLDDVGVDDNFFSLNGDSIKSIQLVARANEAGLVIRPQDVFRHQTIAALAQVATQRTRRVPVVAGDHGRAPVTPTQAWFLDRPHADPDQFNMSVVLALAGDADRQLVARAFEVVVAHHPMLRARFAQVDGVWEQRIEPSETNDIFTVADLTALSPGDRETAAERAIAEAQQGLRLTGPVARAVLLDLGTSRDLLITVHHLVVDGVSWRILCEDLVAAYRDLLAGDAVRKMPQTTPYTAWARMVAAKAPSAGLPVSPAAALPVDRDAPADANVMGDTGVVSTWLSAEETQALLQLPATARIGVDVALLTALSSALAEWTGHDEVAVDIETHGRSVASGDVDLSRTVGWFTAIVPLRVSVNDAAPLNELLHRVSNQVRAAESRTAGAGPSPVAFNYLGRFGAVDGMPLFTGLSGRSAGPIVSPRYVRTHVLDINCVVRDGVLQTDVVFAHSLHRRDTIARLASEMARRVRAVLAACTETAITGLSPADFPLVPLTPADVSAVLAASGDVQDILPLSPVQAGMLFHSLYDPGSVDVYAVQQSFDLAGDIDLARLRHAVSMLMRRHDAVRAVFRVDAGGRAVQVIEREPVVSWREEDVRDLPVSEQLTAAAAFSQGERLRRFDVTQAPLIRWLAVRMTDDRIRLTLTNHHALLDGWSGPILIGELLELYGATDGLRRAPVSYASYFRWLSHQAAEPSTAYWRGYLAGVEPAALLPGPVSGDTARPVAEPDETRLVLNAAETQAIEACARTLGVTASSLVQAAWAILLARLANRTDVVFGMTVATRPPEIQDIERAIGLYINTVPVRVRLDRFDETVRGLLQRLQSEQGDQMPHRHVGLTEVRAAAGLPQDAELFETLVVFENYPIARDQAMAAAAGITVTAAEGHDATHYPLTLLVCPGSQWTLRLMFRPDRVSRAVVDDMTGRLAQLLSAMAAAPATAIGALDVLRPGERHDALMASHGPTLDVSLRTLPELFERQVERTPGAPALVSDSVRVSYDELNRRANRLARALVLRGAGPETTVGIALDRSVDLIVALLATLKAGAAYLPIDLALPAARVRMLLDAASPCCVVTTAADRARLPVGTHVATMADAASASHEETNLSDADRLARLDPRHPAYVLFTSGSTGTPKGVVVPHEGIANQVAWMQADHPCDAGDLVVLKTPLGFDVSAWEMFWPLASGACLLLARPGGHTDAQYLRELLAAHPVTIMHFVPSMLRHFLDAGGRIPRRLERLFASGEALPADLAQRARVELADACFNLYGPTEASVHASWSRVGPDDLSGEAPIGRAVPNTRAYVLDWRLEPVAAGVAGELYLAGEGLARGYLGAPGQTAHRFVADPHAGPGARMYRTGDLARRGSSGAIEFLGRVDQQVKIRGVRIELGEIDAALRVIPGVAQAVTDARPTARGDLQLIAYVVPADGAPLEASALRQVLAERLPAHLIPNDIVVIDAVPTTASGKLDRRALPAPSGRDRFVAPATPSETALCEILADVLGVARVGVTDNFFALGGHSLLATRVVNRLRAVVGVDLPLRTLFEQPTVAELAAAVDRLMDVEDLAL